MPFVAQHSETLPGDDFTANQYFAFLFYIGLSVLSITLSPCALRSETQYLWKHGPATPEKSIAEYWGLVTGCKDSMGIAIALPPQMEDNPKRT